MKNTKKLLFILSVLLICTISIPLVVNANDEEIETKKEPVISYSTHIQDYGWEKDFGKQDGDISGTEGKSKRLEAIRIKTENLEKDVKIKYQVHVQDIGWQNWKKNGELAGTQGKSLRLEAIRIKLEDSEKYSVEYRVHVQNIGWQKWKQDGAIAGTQGKSLRLEAIQIRLVNKETKGSIIIENGLNEKSYFDKINISGYKFANIKDTKIKVSIDNIDYTDKVNVKYKKRNDLDDKIDYGSDIENVQPGFDFTIDTKELEPKKHKLLLELVTSDGSKTIATCTKEFLTDKDIHILYKSHVQNIGWQNYVNDGNASETSGKALRVEAINIKAVNLPEGVNLKYQTHIQDIGWQDWKNENTDSGTIGKSKRIEALKIKLENTEEYSIEYRAHVQDIGWQKWKQDGALAGTVGESKRIEAIQIRVVKKENKGKITIETDMSKPFFEEISVKGWKMTNVENTKLKVFLDENEVTNKANIRYQERKDLSQKIDYGSEIENAKPGFTFSISTSDIKAGKHNLRVELVTKDEKIILDSQTKIINIDKNVHIEYQSHVQDEGWQSYVLDGATSGTIGKTRRIEALNIKLHNLPEGVKIKYQAHIQDIGWQDWKSGGETAGTTGQAKRIEGIKIKLENTDKYSIIYRAHVQNYGWQDWANDGEMSGTVLESRAIEAIEIKIVDKITEKRTRVYLDNIGTITNEAHNIAGWLMTNEANVSLKFFIDNSQINTSLTRKRDQGVYNQIKGYGGEELNPQPRFITSIDFSKYSIGNHTIKVQAISRSGSVIQESSRTVNIIKKIEHYKDVYGYTGLATVKDSRGAALEYFRYGNGPNVFFATFCVHGFEDNWGHDGYELVDIAHQFYNRLVEMNDYGIVDKWTIYIMQCVNPDGVNVGYTNNGPGRTTLHSDVGKGIDLNRCWSTNFAANYTNRNYTGSSPFLAVESRYLRDFILSHQSRNGINVLVDLHGWTQQLIGDPVLRNYYRTQFPENTDTASYGRGFLINWARINLHSPRAALIELPSNNYSHNDVVNHNLANRYIEATLSMLRQI